MPDMCYYLTGAPQPVLEILKMRGQGYSEIWSTRGYQVRKALDSWNPRASPKEPINNHGALSAEPVSKDEHGGRFACGAGGALLPFTPQPSGDIKSSCPA